MLVCAAGMMVIALITSKVLYKYMLEPRPTRDLTINSNIWLLTLPAKCFNETGQNIRKLALRTVIILMAIAVITLMYVGIVLWLK